MNGERHDTGLNDAFAKGFEAAMENGLPPDEIDCTGCMGDSYLIGESDGVVEEHPCPACNGTGDRYRNDRMVAKWFLVGFLAGDFFRWLGD